MIFLKAEPDTLFDFGIGLLGLTSGLSKVDGMLTSPTLKSAV